MASQEPQLWSSPPLFQPITLGVQGAARRIPPALAHICPPYATQAPCPAPFVLLTLPNVAFDLMLNTNTRFCYSDTTAEL